MPGRALEYLNRMKKTLFTVLSVFVLALSCSVFSYAQQLPVPTVAVVATTNSVPGVTDMLTAPPSANDLWTAAISAVTPLLVWALARYVPRIPRSVLPLTTPFIGILLGLILNQLAKLHLTGIDMAKAGGLAIAIREVVNQTVTKRLQSADTDDTDKADTDKAPPPDAAQPK